MLGVSDGRISGGHASLGQEHAPIRSRRRSSDDGERHNAMSVRPLVDRQYLGQLAVVREPTGSVGRHRRSVMLDGDSDRAVSRQSYRFFLFLTFQSKVAGEPSTLPAGFVARIWKICLPLPTLSRRGDMHGVKPSPSRLHSNVEAGSLEVNSKVACF